MLNELRELSNSLKRAGVSQEDWHQSFHECPKSNGLRVYLSKHGIEEIEPVAVDEIFGKIRKWEPNNGDSFPVFNIQPLCSTKGIKDVKKREEAKEAKKKVVASIQKKINAKRTITKDEIAEARKGLEETWASGKVKKKVERCLNMATTVGKLFKDKVPDEYRALSDLIKMSKEMTADKLLSKLEELAVNGLIQNKIKMVDILFGERDFQILLDSKDVNYQFPVTHRKVQEWMNAQFLKPNNDNTSKGGSVFDAYGESAALTRNLKTGKDVPFPPVRVPVLGNVILRSMANETPAQIRYGMIEGASFPSGDKVRREMKAALEWLSDLERNGKTWCALNESSILFAYPAQIPPLPPELASLLGRIGDIQEHDQDGSLFSAVAGRVIQALQSIATSHPDTEIKMFVLSKMDKARTKVSVSRCPNVSVVIKAAESWEAGCRNIPDIQIRRFGKEQGETLWAKPLIPFPGELVWCLNTAWRKMGTRPEKVHGYSIDDALSILLDTGHIAKRLALRATNTIVRNASSLLLAVVQEGHSAKVLKVDKAYLKQPLLLPSILGLLLYKLDLKEGGDMSSSTFLVGRFMSTADKLHLKYCEHVRKGSFPPQLVGNALMSTALEEPTKALSILSRRILPYQAWANTFKEGPDVGLVKYFLSQLGKVSENLKDLEIPLKCSDADKAQMLLGYLAKAAETHN